MNYAAEVFYNRFKERISGIKTARERVCILSDMQADFERMVRDEPDSRNSLSEVYSALKLKCWKV